MPGRRSYAVHASQNQSVNNFFHDAAPKSQLQLQMVFINGASKLEKRHAAKPMQKACPTELCQRNHLLEPDEWKRERSRRCSISVNGWANPTHSRQAFSRGVPIERNSHQPQSRLRGEDLHSRTVTLKLIRKPARVRRRQLLLRFQCAVPPLPCIKRCSHWNDQRSTPVTGDFESSAKPAPGKVRTAP